MFLVFSLVILALLILRFLNRPLFKEYPSHG